MNLEHDGWTPDGRGGGHLDKWYAAHEELARLPLDVLFCQERTHSAANGQHLMHVAERMLAMRGFLAPASPAESPNPCAVFVREDTFRVTGQWPQSANWWHAPCAVSVTYSEEPVRIQLASVHLSSRSAAQRKTETENIITWQQPQRALVVAGDFNSYSASGLETTPAPDWPNLPDQRHRAQRTLDGHTPDTVPDRILTSVGMADAAVLAARLGHAGALDPTASMIPGKWPRQGPAQRIDRQYVSGALAPALRSFEVVPLPGLSDHALTLSTWDPDLFLAGLHCHSSSDQRSGTGLDGA
ncbi:endonuclease/exonuclease/phosphatase family protein [Kitasatospora viridis]|uniref:endonuclease/exonuclease/phosphatase family protein n=1 Tax=Kitasatospora viridis TaxID=281105 RepID=UPI0014782D17|nr:endonuclease/exonuclease/phosphatase family protein [Kitasatospora viridis]